MKRFFKRLAKRVAKNPRSTAQGLAMLGVPFAGTVAGFLPDAPGFTADNWQAAAVHAGMLLLGGAGAHALVSTDSDKTDEDNDQS